MCLSTVYVSRDSLESLSPQDPAPEKLIDKVQIVDVDGDLITCTNLYGQSARVHGGISRIDFAHSRVYLCGTAEPTREDAL